MKSWHRADPDERPSVAKEVRLIGQLQLRRALSGITMDNDDYAAQNYPTTSSNS